MSRKRLLQILQERCRELGVDVRFSTPAPDVDELQCRLRPRRRRRRTQLGRPQPLRRRLPADAGDAAVQVHVARARTWSSTRSSSSWRETPYGVMQIHGYPFDAHRSTFIIEMHEDVWRRAGFDEQSTARCVQKLFSACTAGKLSSFANNSKWISFATVRNERWRHDNVVLLGDAAHTAHFSIGSGTKLAMEDALALAACLHEQPDLDSALTAYEAERRPVVLSTQRAAQASLEWFENLGAVHAIRTRCSSLQHHDAQPSGDLRQPARARPGVRRRGRRVVRAAEQARARRRRRAAADVPAVPAARAGACRTGSWCPRWTCTGRSTASRTTSTSSTWAARRWAGPGWS